jgi:tRNA pseudouridine38-40 synthase
MIASKMARYQIIFAYDGTQFVGSQRQAQKRTVQSVLENALKKLGWEGRSILLAGRTDSGVHAAGQVAAVDLSWRHSEEDLRSALNSKLPQDMAVRSVRMVDNRFHPRFDAHSRHYRYRLYIQPIRDPLRDRYSWRVWPNLEVDLVRDAAALLIGEHDFSAFGSPTRANGSTVRTVTLAKWAAEGEQWIFDVAADAFLYRMVRRMVFTQVAVGLGRIDLEDFRQAVEVQKTLIAGLASPAGLTLVEVTYEKDDQKS